MNTTPRKCSRSRDSIEEDEDDHALDAMLIELGIPTNNHTKKDISIEVIELITPPRTSPPAKKQKQSVGPSFVDLTTSPAPPCPFSSLTNSNICSPVQETIEVEDKHQPDEIPFSSSECPSSFVYFLSSETENSPLSSSPNNVSSNLPSTTRRQVFPDERIQNTEEKQARRLSGRLEDLHFETLKKKTETTSTTTATAATGDNNNTTTAAAAESSRASAESSRASAGSTTGEALSSQSRAAGGKCRGVADVIAVVQMEKSLDTSVAGETIRDALKSHVYNGKPVPFTVATALNCILPGVIRWKRRGSGTSYYSCAIYYTAGVYLKLLQMKSYMELIAAVQYLKTLVPKTELGANIPRQLEEESSKFFIIVEGMDHALIKLKKQQKQGSTLNGTSSTTFPMITFADLHEVAFQLFMDVGAHTKFTSDLDATANYIALLTRELVVASSRASALEESLEAVPRYNSFRVNHTGATASACANAWLRMLQVIPGVSEDKAQCLLDHFPTFGSLMRAYRDPNLSRTQKQNLVADKLHDARIQRALSKRIYAVFCEENPEALI
ncbi:unnamed protein product [Peronospora destructor]|uniref:ERCC4 domain-containing protein n=1 Tax=Peronospora destructor TaxID=86335 RepID=A0AAV0V3D2_9STRA|nr:unnamed protein product [Peronospora destructor]